MSAKVKASEVQAESAKDIKDDAVEVAAAEAAKKAEADAKAKADKEAQAKAEQAEADAKAKAEKEAQAKAQQVEADAKAKAEKEAQAKAEQAEADAKAKAEKEAKTEPVELKPWNGEPLMPAPEGETVETAKAAPLKLAKTSGKTYRALWTLHHDNKRYIEGDTLTLSDDDAEDLVDAGVLVVVK